MRTTGTVPENMDFFLNCTLHGVAHFSIMI